MGATHFRAISESEIFSSCGERLQAKGKPTAASAFTLVTDSSSCAATYRCSQLKDPEETETLESPAEIDNQQLAAFLHSHISRRRQAMVVEAATFDNGVMAAMCTTKRRSASEIQQHAAVLSPSELEFWGVDPRRACGGDMKHGDRAAMLVGRGLAMAQLDWIWEDTLHRCKLRGINLVPAPEDLDCRVGGWLEPYPDSEYSEGSPLSENSGDGRCCQVDIQELAHPLEAKDASQTSSVLGFLIESNRNVN